MKTGWCSFLAGLAGLAPSHAAPGIDRAVERALPYLEEEGTWWIEKKACVSCHHTTYFTWAKDLALQAGFEVDESTLAEQRKWMWESFLEEKAPDPKNPDNAPESGQVNGDSNVEGVSQFLVSASAAAAPESVVESLREIVLSNQDDKGNWKPGGQLPRQQRDATETQWISNQWAEYALKGKVPLPLPTTTWADGVPATTSEWFMVNLLLRPQNPHSLRALLKRQNKDGGWSWKDGEASGPTGTGQALIALARSGKAKDHPEAVESAQAFLVGIQSDEGHWETMSTKDREESTRVSDFWGTAWAIIGLLESSRP